VGHAEIEAPTKRSNRGVSVGILDEPSTLADPRHEALRGPEQTPFHEVFCNLKVYAAWR